MHYGAIILGKAHSGVAILTLHYGAKILRNAHSGDEHNKGLHLGAQHLQCNPSYVIKD